MEALPFDEIIEQYLNNLAKEDKAFAEKYANKKKSIKECVDYIYGEVSKARTNSERCLAFSDAAIFGLAVHYYDEDSVEVAANNVDGVAAAPEAVEKAPETAKEPKTRKSRKSKAVKAPAVVVSEVDENIPDDLDIPLF